MKLEVLPILRQEPPAAMKPASRGKGKKDRIVADDPVANHLALIFVTAKKGLKRAGFKVTEANMHVAAEEVAKMLRHKAPHANRTPTAA